MESADLSVLVDAALEWRNGDPDPRTRTELDTLLEQATGDDRAARSEASAELADRFAGSLQFGTAGLRGALGAGPNRMNRAVVIRAASGLGTYLHGLIGAAPVVVVGYDARTDSDVFARDTCAVLTAAGAGVRLLPGPLPTPVLAYAVRSLDADAGVMVTASHNPPQDNGYKVFLGGRAAQPSARGVQIVPPDDALIAEAIDAAPPAVAIPMVTGGWSAVGTSIVEGYIGAICTAVQAITGAGGPRDLAIVLTPLHGVGGDVCVRALTTAGFAAPFVVPEQAEPDATFPTVTFPNPEEPGAMDAALTAARARGADLVIANDPDADRCAVAVPDPNADGGWRALRGDEVGALLGDALLRGLAGSGGIADGRDAVVASTIVSSQLLGRIAAASGARHVETLTGFKWLARVPGLVYAYEEALGYCVAPEVVRDKDGISAALLVAAIAARLRAEGRTLLDALDDLARSHGVHATEQLSIREAEPDRITRMVDHLRESPPATLGGEDVVRFDDLAAGGDGLPPTPGVRLWTADGGRAVVRPSGTEPKLKCYLEVVVDVKAPAGTPDDSADISSADISSADISSADISSADIALAAAKARAAERLAAIRRDLAQLLLR